MIIMVLHYCPITKRRGVKESLFKVVVYGVDFGIKAVELDYRDPAHIEFLEAHGYSIDEEKPRTLIFRLPCSLDEEPKVDGWIKEGHLSELNSELEKHFEDIYLAAVRGVSNYAGRVDIVPQHSREAS